MLVSRIVFGRGQLYVIDDFVECFIMSRGLPKEQEHKPPWIIRLVAYL